MSAARVPFGRLGSASMGVTLLIRVTCSILLFSKLASTGMLIVVTVSQTSTHFGGALHAA